MQDLRFTVSATYGIDALVGDWTAPSLVAVGIVAVLGVVRTALGAVCIRARIR